MFSWSGQVRGVENHCDRPSAATNLVKQAGSVHKIKGTAIFGEKMMKWKHHLLLSRDPFVFRVVLMGSLVNSTFFKCLKFLQKSTMCCFDFSLESTFSPTNSVVPISACLQENHEHQEKSPTLLAP